MSDIVARYKVCPSLGGVHKGGACCDIVARRKVCPSLGRVHKGGA